MILNNGYYIPDLCMGTDIVSPILFEDRKVLKFFKILYHKIKGDQSLKRSIGINKCFQKAHENDLFFFDTSRAYSAGEKMISKVIARNRSKYYVCTKLCNRDILCGKSARESLAESLKQLGTDYVDLYLIHWPVKGKYLDYWKQLEELYEEGLVRAIGVSNCKIHHLEELKKIAHIMPMVNEVEMHPLLTENELRQYCEKNNIKIMAYSSTARNDFRLFKSRRLGDLSKKYGKSITQIILRWHYQNGIIPIFNTSTVEHMRENCNIFDFVISDEDMKIIDMMNINSRTRYDSDNCEWDRL